jgi:16S rRNA (uracil1498-N3)-methyltransferase
MAYEGVLQAIDKHSLSVTLECQLPVPKSSLPPVTLAVALIKEQRWDWLLQKATELGVRAFQPILSERTVIKLSESDIPKKLERWQSVVRSAAEQSEGLFIPQMLKPVNVSQCAQSGSSDRLRILLAERGEDRLSLKSVLSGLQQEKMVTMAVGPEGGWTPQELDVFIQAGFVLASLGSRILRSETAAIAAMAGVVYESGV